jgi:hypothetical protein
MSTASRDQSDHTTRAESFGAVSASGTEESFLELMRRLEHPPPLREVMDKLEKEKKAEDKAVRRSARANLEAQVRGSFASMLAPTGSGADTGDRSPPRLVDSEKTSKSDSKRLAACIVRLGGPHEGARSMDPCKAICARCPSLEYAFSCQK